MKMSRSEIAAQVESKLLGEEYNKGAFFDEDRKNRFSLWRIWDNCSPYIQYVGLNPSTANAEKDDPTIRRLVSLTKFNGYGGFFMTNLYSLITPYPEELVNQDFQRGFENKRHLIHPALNIKDIAYCWGNFKIAKSADLSWQVEYKPLCFGKNKDGSPKHPLYLKGDTKLIPYL